MAENSQRPRGALLVGSAPVSDAEEMFRTSMRHLGDHIRRLPDGEVGERDTWIAWQNPRLRACPQIRRGETPGVYVRAPYLELIDGVERAEQIQLPDMGYATAAIESYQVFKRLKDDGVIPRHMRFQVGLPTPLSVMIFFVHPRDRDTVEQAYWEEIIRQLGLMTDAIPPAELAIQWETVAEFAILEGVAANHLGEHALVDINSRLARLVNAVPAGVEAGLHLCYGDAGHKHFCQPTDTGHLVSVIKGVLEQVDHALGWIHLPVPKEREDEDYYRPLANLKLPESTELYLGLVHQTGGIESTNRRIAAAARVVGRFGVATECGLGRRSPETLLDLLDQHAAAADPAAR